MKPQLGLMIHVTDFIQITKTYSQFSLNTYVIFKNEITCHFERNFLGDGMDGGEDL